MNPILHHVDLITRSRRRGEIGSAVVEALHRILGTARSELHKIMPRATSFLVGLSTEIAGAGTGVSHDDNFAWPDRTGSIENHPYLRRRFGHDAPEFDRLPDDSVRLVQMVRNDRHEPLGFLVLERPAPFTADEIGIVQGFASLLRNCLALLEYSETDTLTRLLNRKTFDEYLMRILANIPLQDDAAGGALHLPQRRHGNPAARDHWLGVMDIDRFKLINDRFGHLIGDEVLILLANLMRESFRVQDKLFRFGGEEFVALLRPAADIELF